MKAAIYVNGRALGKANSGIGRYTFEIVKRLEGRLQILQPRAGSRGIAGHLWEQAVLPVKLPNDAVLWSPANTGPLRVVNQVLSLHDVSVLEHPQWFAPGFAAWYRFLLPRLVEHVRKIITVSEFSRGRIVELLNVPEEKIVVIPNGVDHEHFYPRSRSEIDAVKAQYNISRDYVLTVGSLQPRKNLQRLFAAWQKISPEHTQFTLVVVGVEGNVFRDRGYGVVPPNVHLLGGVPDTDLPTLYSGALACVQPSLYEGFNLPVLEAMACGVPVLAANTSATPEVVGDAGMLFDPLNVNAISEALRAVLVDQGLRDEFSAKGLERAKLYTWEKSAESVWKELKASQ